MLALELSYIEAEGYILTAIDSDKLIAACSHKDIETAQNRMDLMLIELGICIYSQDELN